MAKFDLQSRFKPTKYQEDVVQQLVDAKRKGLENQVLLGVTGSGKTFTVANVIEQLQRPTLVISHNKTLAAQLYQEFRDFFPDNAVSYFVSYYDYYQPEAYIPSTDTYIEKDAGINDMIDKLRLASTTNLLTKRDVIVVASVSCIYNIGSPAEYAKFIFELSNGLVIDRKAIIDRLIELQYERGDFGFHRGTFRVRGSAIDIFPAYRDEGVRIEQDGDKIVNLQVVDVVTGKVLQDQVGSFVLYPAKHNITDPKAQQDAFEHIKHDMQERVAHFERTGKLLEANRLKQKVTYDMEMLQEVGYIKGIENYSRYFDGRQPGEPPYTLLDFFTQAYKDEWLVVVDESHITFPQIRGMHAGDAARKETLIDYGFRLPSARDNRPLTFDEFMRRIPGFLATSATPAEWEINIAQEAAGRVYGTDFAKHAVVEQLLRPTGIADPQVEIRPLDTQVADVIAEITARATKPQKERSLVTTLTKKTAEDLADYLKEKGIKVHYLHSDVKTLERTDILDDLRRGTYDCIVGVNLLREGLDLPEVSLVAILDADKEGFLRSEVSLIQTMGRAARHVDGKVIMYANKVTGSMQRALAEVDRRRAYQLEMNKKYGVTPTSISKPIREKVAEEDDTTTLETILETGKIYRDTLPEIDATSLTPIDRKKLIAKLRREMKLAARDLHFELAAELRDKIKELELD